MDSDRVEAAARDLMRAYEAAVQRLYGRTEWRGCVDAMKLAVVEVFPDIATAPPGSASPAPEGDQPDALDEAAALLADALPHVHHVSVTADGGFEGGMVPVTDTARRILELTVAEAVQRVRAELFTDGQAPD